MEVSQGPHSAPSAPVMLLLLKKMAFLISLEKSFGIR